MKQQESKPFAGIYRDLLADGWAEYSVTAAIDILRQGRRQLSTESVKLWLMQNTLRHREGQGVIKCPAMAPDRPSLPLNPSEGEELRAKAKRVTDRAIKRWPEISIRDRAIYEEDERMKQRYLRNNQV